MRDLLRFITCGSVDDGKSTLIGHIIYNSKLFYADQKRALELESKVGSRGGAIDYSLILDGLTEEREQGITIDVAYRYFTTDRRSFIVADTPGHEEYTRNMAVGASFADLAIILIDAEKGVLTQTRRHARICSIMGIRYFVFAVNKMDLVQYEKERFDRIKNQIIELKKDLPLQNIKVIPVSATEGDNVSQISENMTWYKGDTLLSYLEQVDVTSDQEEKGFYFPVQRVSRPDHTFRGFQGQIESGQIFVGDEIKVLPGKETAHVKTIFSGELSVKQAIKGQGVTIQLDREIDVSRGSVLSRNADLNVTDSIIVTLIWMDDKPLENGSSFFVKLGTNLIPGLVSKILYTIDINTGSFYDTNSIQKNEIAVCRIVFTDKIVVDTFRKHKTLGELILIDRVTFMTSACGVIDQYDQYSGLTERRIGIKTRSIAMGQQAVTVVFSKERGFTKEILENVEKQLILAGRHTYLLEENLAEDINILWEVVRHLNRAGLVVLFLREQETEQTFLSDISSHCITYLKEELDEENVVAFIQKISKYDSHISDAMYI